MARECSFYTFNPHLLRHHVGKLEPDASYQRAHRLQFPKILKSTGVEQTHREGGRGK